MRICGRMVSMKNYNYSDNSAKASKVYPYLIINYLYTLLHRRRSIKIHFLS